MSLNKFKNELKKAGSKKNAEILQWFFKTGRGEYGEGDKFLGIKIPEIRKIAKKNKKITFPEIHKALKSKHHEERLAALLILVDSYSSGNEKTKEDIARFYLKNTKYINNWDLVDLTAPKILGKHLIDRDRKILTKLAHSENLWEKRISIVSTFEFIRAKQFSDTLKISRILLKDEHDLIHKAVGWMLREIGKRSMETEENFLLKHYKKMPRTMLRYAIEKFPEKKRRAYLEGRI
ncbi:MAG TPA: DNA alkylation repair protein [Ignavibacteriaceae bacterium]|nr:DNA alkylation repair protein [Ignavibacteriaceae bacterium]